MAQLSAGDSRSLRDRYRIDVSGAKRGAPLVKVVSALRTKGYAVSGETYKKPPASVEFDHPRVQLLKHSGLVAEWAGKPPKEFTSAAFVGFAAKHFHAVAPLHAWLSGLRE